MKPCFLCWTGEFYEISERKEQIKVFSLRTHSSRIKPCGITTQSWEYSYILQPKVDKNIKFRLHTLSILRDLIIDKLFFEEKTLKIILVDIFFVPLHAERDASAIKVANDL